MTKTIPTAQWRVSSDRESITINRNRKNGHIVLTRETFMRLSGGEMSIPAIARELDVPVNSLKALLRAVGWARPVPPKSVTMECRIPGCKLVLEQHPKCVACGILLDPLDVESTAHNIQYEIVNNKAICVPCYAVYGELGTYTDDPDMPMYDTPLEWENDWWKNWAIRLGLTKK